MMHYFELTEVISSHAHQWGGGAFFVLYILVIFLLIYNRHLNRCYKNIAISLSIISLIRYFPPIVNFFALHFFKGHEFARVGWGLLVVPVISIGLVCAIEELSEKKRRINAFIVIVSMCFLIGINAKSYFKLPDNKYKLPQEAVDVEHMVELVGCETDVGLTFCPSSGTQSFKQIELVYYGLKAYGCFDYQVIASSQEVVDGKYEVLITSQDYYKDYVVAGGYEEVGETDNVIVYKKPLETAYK